MDKLVMCCGTFDGLHLGHIAYLKQARKFGINLIVVVARDKNVKKIKGHWPQRQEMQRLEDMRKLDFVNQAILGQVENRYNIINKIKPDIICLGYDQPVDMAGLRKIYQGKIIRLKAYKEHKYKSAKLKVGQR